MYVRRSAENLLFTFCVSSATAHGVESALLSFRSKQSPCFHLSNSVLSELVSKQQQKQWLKNICSCHCMWKLSWNKKQCIFIIMNRAELEEVFNRVYVGQYKKNDRKKVDGSKTLDRNYFSRIRRVSRNASVTNLLRSRMVLNWLKNPSNC